MEIAFHVFMGLLGDVNGSRKGEGAYSVGHFNPSVFCRFFTLDGAEPMT
jgi:hypothetical protein